MPSRGATAIPPSRSRWTRSATRTIRLPGLEVGRGQYIAVIPGSFGGMGLAGDFVDMKCDPVDGAPRFANQGDYVSRYADVADDLVSQRFLLQSDAFTKIDVAAASEPCFAHSSFLPRLVGERGLAGDIDRWRTHPRRQRGLLR